MLGINIEQEEERDAQSHKLRTFFSAVWYQLLSMSQGTVQVILSRNQVCGCVCVCVCVCLRTTCFLMV